MSANDVLDVLNIQRDKSGQPSKKKSKPSSENQNQSRQSGIARELYNLLGPNTPPVNLPSGANAAGVKDKWKANATPWTRKEFHPKSEDKDSLALYHWVRGSKELLEQESQSQPYFFRKFNTNVDIPDLVDEDTYNKYMSDIQEQNRKERLATIKRERELKQEREERERKEREKQAEKEKQANEKHKGGDSSQENEIQGKIQGNPAEDGDKDGSNSDKKSKEPIPEDLEDDSDFWSYEETAYLFDLCKSFELKWHVIYDRYNYATNRSQEDLKEQFYRICKCIYTDDTNSNPALTEALGTFSKSKEVERKQYLERLLKRTPAEIAEEESLVIEARRFELAAKKMLLERSNLLTLLDSPQTSQSVQQYLSSQGLTNLYNNLMILDKNQKKRQLQQQSIQNEEPTPPQIPAAASSSVRRERNFQTHLQQYLTSLVKQNQNSNIKGEPSPIQKLLMKRLTAKEEEAYGLYYHANEKINPGVVLRSTQRLPGLQQRQSVLKSVNTVLEELDISTAGGTSWKPVMPTRKTMAKYDELLRSVIALLDIKRGRDKLEAEIQLIRSQRGLD